MLKHIVMFSLKESAEGHSKEANAARLKVLLESLKDQISEVRYLEVGMNQGRSESADDIVLYSEFEDMQALEVYRKHPEHAKVVDFIRKVCTERRVVDYETSGD